MSYTHVDKPIKIGKLEIKNRTFRPAHATDIGRGWMSDALIAYHEERARGGVGLIINEVGSVHSSSRLYQNLFDPEFDVGMRKLVDRIKPHGTRVFQQLWHGGNTLGHDGVPPWSSSDLPNIVSGHAPISMTKAMIDEIVGAFADGARRMEACGLDGVDLHFAHGYLPAQFYSPATNKRDDDYGGPIENRMRFMIEIATAIRSNVSSNFVVGARIGNDLAPGGIGEAETILLARTLEAKGLVDYINLSVGSYDRNDKMIGGMNEPTGYQLATSIPIAQTVKLPAFVSGRFRTLEEADQVIRAGEADMVGLVRAMIADPYLVTKSLAGESHRVRPCIACNQSCVTNLFIGVPVECAVNPGTAHELERGDHLLKPVAEARTVLVVGGGPAGMEAARVAAMRGHKVILADANPYLGGAIKAAGKVPTRHNLLDITTWLEEEIFRLGVDVRLSSYMDVDDVLEIGADVVIVATGSMERMDGIQMSHVGEPIKNIGRKGVISSTELFMAPPANLGKTAVVLDDVGHFEGLGSAEYLINQGLEVTYITPRREVAPIARLTLMVEPYLQRMEGKPFRYMIRTRGIAIGEKDITVGPAYLYDTMADSVTIPADTVVLVSVNRQNRDLYDGLVGQVPNLHVIGDAGAPRYIQTAIREGHIAGAAA